MGNTSEQQTKLIKINFFNQAGSTESTPAKFKVTSGWVLQYPQGILTKFKIAPTNKKEY